MTIHEIIISTDKVGDDWAKEITSGLKKTGIFTERELIDLRIRDRIRAKHWENAAICCRVGQDREKELEQELAEVTRELNLLRERIQ